MACQPKYYYSVCSYVSVFPTLKEEYLSIKDAMRMRGIRFGSNPVAMLEYRFVPLIISMVKIGNELSAAAMTRGLGSDIKRTNMCKIGFGIADIFFLLRQQFYVFYISLFEEFEI